MDSKDFVGRYPWNILTKFHKQLSYLHAFSNREQAQRASLYKFIKCVMQAIPYQMKYGLQDEHWLQKFP